MCRTQLLFFWVKNLNVHVIVPFNFVVYIYIFVFLVTGMIDKLEIKVVGVVEAKSKKKK